MKHTISLAIVAALIVTGVLLSLTVGAGGGSETKRSAALAYPDVWEALETAPSVEVYIGVVPPAGSAQLNILAALGPEDFQLTYTFERYGLSGRVTKSGLIILANHPDVRGVVIPGTGTRGSVAATTGIVDPAVWEALEDAIEVRVFISLREMDGPIQDWNLDLRAEHAATVQENVLSALDDGDLTDIYQPRVAALGGNITRHGVERLANHPDVVDLRKAGGVSIDELLLE